MISAYVSLDRRTIYTVGHADPIICASISTVALLYGIYAELFPQAFKELEGEDGHLRVVLSSPPEPLDIFTQGAVILFERTEEHYPDQFRFTRDERTHANWAFEWKLSEFDRQCQSMQ